MFNLRLTRFSSSEQSSLGMLHGRGEQDNFLCFTLEDQYQEEKVAGETRIPAGEYPLDLRRFGGFHARYNERFGFHIGMIEIVGVPGFSDVLIHCGNTDEDTRGCILLGDGAQQNITARGRISSSTLAYERVYPIIARSIESGESASLHIVDYA